jgi:hypothetical protein
MLILFAIAAGCVPSEPSTHSEPLTVYAIPGLPSYEGGRVLHPWHFRKLPKDRFPAVATGKAADANCFLADSYYRKCLILQCDESLTCEPGARCVDAALAFDPDGSTESATPSGAAVFLAPDGTVYPVLHLAVCLKT